MHGSAAPAVMFLVSHLPRPAHSSAGVAIGLALLSTGCYAVSAVLQEREASRAAVDGALWQLARRPWWCLAVLAAGVGALLHIVALAFGPLSLVQPVGVMTLVLALPLGARVAGRWVTRREWLAAAVVTGGLATVLAVLPHSAHRAHLSSTVLWVGTGAVGVLVLALLVLAVCLSGRAKPVLRAAAAATCFGFASGMARAAAIGSASLTMSVGLAIVGAAAGLVLAQLAYRTGGLGAPLATQILIDPLVAVAVGIALLHEPVLLTPVRIAVGLIGFGATAGGIWGLTHRPLREPVTL
jgi:hypothetical protein